MGEPICPLARLMVRLMVRLLAWQIVRLKSLRRHPLAMPAFLLDPGSTPTAVLCDDADWPQPPKIGRAHV